MAKFNRKVHETTNLVCLRYTTFRQYYAQITIERASEYCLKVKLTKFVIKVIQLNKREHNWISIDEVDIYLDTKQPILN